MSQASDLQARLLPSYLATEKITAYHKKGCLTPPHSLTPLDLNPPTLLPPFLSLSLLLSRLSSLSPFPLCLLLAMAGLSLSYLLSFLPAFL